MGSNDGQWRYAIGTARGIHRYAGLPIPVVWNIGDVADEPDDGVDNHPGEEPVLDWEDELLAAKNWAQGIGLSEGTDLNTPITRGEMLVMLHRLHRE